MATHTNTDRNCGKINVIRAMARNDNSTSRTCFFQSDPTDKYTAVENSNT